MQTYKPWPYQQHAIQWILDHERCGLFLEMGLGKTVVTLTAIKSLLDDFAVSRVLVIAPLRVAATVWQEETQKWSHLTGLRCSKILGNAAAREAAIAADADIYIINRENVSWLVEKFAKRKRWPFDMIVLDELSSFKSNKSLRFRALKRVRNVTTRIVGLTGTPAPNGLMDLWSQIYLLDGGARLETSIGAYRERYFTEGRRSAQVVFDWRPKPGAADAIYGKISDICMSMTAADYLDLPEQRSIVHQVEMTEQEHRIYDTLERDLVLPYKGEVITAANAAVLTGKLLQISNGAIYNEDHSYAVIHDRKVDALEDLIEAANGQPVLVYYAFQHDADRIRARFPEARLMKTSQEVTDWNAGRIPVLLAHPDSAGHGLNLQAGGHIIIWFGLTWSLEKYQQANARLHRQGQKAPVAVYHIITKETVDETVLRVLEGKEHRQDALIDAVKARIDTIAG